MAVARRARRTRIRAAAGVFALTIGSTACSSGETTITADPETTIAQDDVVEAAPAPDVVEPSTEDLPATPPALGQTDVGVITRLPVVDIEWTATELDLPAAASGTWLSRVVADGDAVSAFGFEWDEQGRQTVHTWRSSDGVDWVHAETLLPLASAMNDVVVTEGTVVGVGNSWTDSHIEPLVWFADDAGGWEAVDLASSGLDLHDTYVVAVAGNDAGFVLGASREHYEVAPSIGFETDGYRFEQNDRDGTYVLTEVATGRLVSTGEVADLFPANENGQTIFADESGTVLTVVPWEVWSQMYPQGSPLPILTDVDSGAPVLQPVEWEGHRILVDEVNARFEVTDAATGLVEVSGDLDELYRGPSPTFVDVVTGEVALRFTWEQWDQQLSDAYMASEAAHVPHESEQLLLFSPDGRQWSERVLTTDENTHVESVVTAGGQFVVSLVDHQDYGATRRAYVSTDGVTWAEQTATALDSLGSIVSGATGAVALSYPEGGTAVATTDDGVTWNTSIFALPTGGERTLWLRQVAIGEAGAAALATLDPPEASGALAITVGSRTARFGVDGSALEIIDDASGDVLLQLGWDEWSQAIEAGAPTYATYADAATTFWSADGAPLMTITDDEAQRGFEQQSRQYQEGIDHVLLLERGGQWHEAPLPDVDGASPDQLAVSSQTVVVGLVRYPQEFEQVDDVPPTQITLLVGHVVG